MKVPRMLAGVSANDNAPLPNSKSAKTTPNAELSPHEATQKSLRSHLTMACFPYAELIRIDKPVAFLYLYFPCLFGTLLAASVSQPVTQPFRLLRINLVFILGSLLVRCAGCSWNDIVDQDIDRKVSRTRNRPLARRAISTSAALSFTVVQVILGLGLVWLLLPLPCMYYSVPSIFGTALFPFAKRFTYYPQLVLGSVFSWGVILAFPALEVELSSHSQAMKAMASLYLSCIAWTMSYDTIYAAQDIKDDLKAGVKSPVVRHLDGTRMLLYNAVLTQLSLLLYTGIAIEASGIYFLCTCFATGAILLREVMSVDLADPKDCLWWFKKGCFYTGILISSGFCGEYITRINWPKCRGPS